MLKKLFLWIFIFSTLFWVSFASENAKVETIIFSVFSRENCVHCIDLKKFLDKNFASGSIVSPKYYSIDEEKNKLLFDERRSYGYSCIVGIDQTTVGVLYEGRGDIYFVRLPITDIIK